MAAASMLTTVFSPLALLRPSASFARLRRAAPTAAVVVRAAAKSTAAAAAPNKKRAATGITIPRPVSPALQAFMGAAEVPRTEAMKRIWAYIKQNNLQDPEDKKIIVCDEKLKALFAGRERVGFLEVAKLLSPHFVKVP
ncbi:upstream activation factor subunit spp27 [Hordeum vulgare subsp. vulgare]|uniref:Predicted protein n=1 Tax=Hordeum vulgare subsp. vulgare TaxID=112509 RepID=F2E6W2_HORVV|nr:upstream activation factor subunit spp27 [Hordeum vulgare subsp. vulgare]BAK03084.1 predicted protein [Hordeum vulgare subsp. vulgare]BAK07017.1 predicted protein [Hordeum vulgare subsp. vulgare]